MSISPNPKKQIKKSNSNAKLGKKALMRKLVMKNASTKVDHIVAKYNYTGKKSTSAMNKTM